MGRVFPDPLRANDALPAQYFLTQSLSKAISVLLGKVAVVDLADQTLLGNNSKHYFANFTLTSVRQHSTGRVLINRFGKRGSRMCVSLRKHRREMTRWATCRREQMKRTVV